MTFARGIVFAVYVASLAPATAYGADCSALLGAWVSYRSDNLGNPAEHLVICSGSIWDMFSPNPGGLFQPPYVVKSSDGQALHGACVEAPGGVGIIIGALPLSSPSPTNELYTLVPGDTPASGLIQVNGFSYSTSRAGSPIALPRYARHSIFRSSDITALWTMPALPPSCCA